MKRRLISKRPAFVVTKDLKSKLVNILQKLRTEKLAVVALVLLVGITTLLLVRAAPFTASIEPESAACAPMVQSNAQASGLSYVRFAAGACTTSCAGQTINSYCWKPIRLGAGGFATGIDTASDGTRVVRTDSAGAYIWDDNLNGGEWRPFITKSALAGTGLDTPKSGGGVMDVAIAQSNPNVIYMAWKGTILKSTNKGLSWTKLNIEGNEMEPNYNCRAWGDRLAVDPINENVVYWGSITRGLYYTSDGNNFTKVASVPVAQEEWRDASWGRNYLCGGENYVGTPGITAVAFDKSSGSTNGRTNTIYVSSHKNGIYRSTNASNSFSQLAGGPTSAVHGKAIGGKYYVVAWLGWNAGTNSYPTSVMRYDGSSWATISPSGWDGVVSGTEVPSLTVDYNNPTNLAVVNHGGDLWVSTNSGSNWASETSHRMLSPDIPWIASEQYLVVSEIAFDKQVANRLWLSMGSGVTYADLNMTNLGQVTWTHKSKGMEQLVQNDIISPPYTAQGQSHLNLAVSDFGNFRILDPDQYNAVRWPVQRFTGSWSLDWASQAPNVVVHNTTDFLQSDREAGYSTDGGVTFSRFASMPQPKPGGFGTIAAGDATHFLWETTQFEQPSRVFYTDNAGNSWSDVTPSDITDNEGLHRSYFAKKKNVAFDRVTPGVAYLYYNNQYIERVYRSTNYGKNWTKVFEATSPGGLNDWALRDTTLTGTVGFFGMTMKPVIGKANHIFLTGGPQGGDVLIGNKDTSGSKLKFSKDGGTTWVNVNGTTGTGIYGFGLGKEKPGTNYPAIYVSGYVQPSGGSEEFGLWRGDSFDPNTGNVTWVKIGDYPMGNLSQVFSIDGDKQVYGKVYLSTGSDGAFYGTPL